jgi:hypothetical protein
MQDITVMDKTCYGEHDDCFDFKRYEEIMKQEERLFHEAFDKFVASHPAAANGQTDATNGAKNGKVREHASLKQWVSEAA